MRIGIFFPSTDLPASPDVLREFSRAVEAMGYDYIVTGDHVLGASPDRKPRLWGPYTDSDRFHDPFVMLSFVAAVTERVELATSILVLPQRQTALVAKQAADLAILSGNRLRLGVGAGWNLVEFDGLGQAFPKRGARLGQQIPLLRALWADPLVTQGTDTEQVDRAGICPRPARPVPIWLGGYSDAALRRGAALGDGFTHAGLLGDIAGVQQRLRRFVEEQGRDWSGFPTELGLIPPVADDQAHQRWPRNRPSFLAGTADAVVGWRECGGTHVNIVTYFMGLESLREHLAYAEKALALARG
jgi:probable F420-dependent oxidoreductase